MVQQEIEFDVADNKLLELFTPSTDNYQVLLQLLDMRWHNAPEYMATLDANNFLCRNFAYRSRISDIGKRIAPEGWEIESRRMAGKPIYEYRLHYIDEE